MTTPFRRRRPPLRVVSVSNHWRLNCPDGIARREVVVELPAGGLQRGYLPDEHPVLVAFLEAVAA